MSFGGGALRQLVFSSCNFYLLLLLLLLFPRLISAAAGWMSTIL